MHQVMKIALMKIIVRQKKPFTMNPAGATADVWNVFLQAAQESNNADLTVTLNQVGRGAFIAAATTAAGGALLGPVGLAVGGGVGGLIAWWTSEEFKPLPVVMQKMNHAERTALLQAITVTLREKNLELSTVALLQPIVKREILVAAFSVIGLNVKTKG